MGPGSGFLLHSAQGDRPGRPFTAKMKRDSGGLIDLPLEGARAFIPVGDRQARVRQPGPDEHPV